MSFAQCCQGQWQKKLCYMRTQLQSTDLLDEPGQKSLRRTIDNSSKAALFFACPAVQSSPRSSLMISPVSYRLQVMLVGLCLFLFREAAAQNQPAYMGLCRTVKAVLSPPS